MLDGFRRQKRMLRATIRNLIVHYKEDLEADCNMQIPENIQYMPKKEFEEWLTTIPRKRLPKYLRELLVEYDCAVENIKIFSAKQDTTTCEQ